MSFFSSGRFSAQSPALPFRRYSIKSRFFMSFTDLNAQNLSKRRSHSSASSLGRPEKAGGVMLTASLVAAIAACGSAGSCCRLTGGSRKMSSSSDSSDGAGSVAAESSLEMTADGDLHCCEADGSATGGGDGDDGWTSLPALNRPNAATGGVAVGGSSERL